MTDFDRTASHYKSYEKRNLRIQSPVTEQDGIQRQP